MNFLLRNSRIQDINSPFNGKVKDILIINGIIKRIDSNISESNAEIFEMDGNAVSPGWVDIFANFCDPGYEQKETLETGSYAANAGGYTHAFLIPNTLPALHSKSQIEYIIEKSKSFPVTLHPIGAVTKNIEGKELAEMYDMHQYSAIAFSDGLHSIQSAGLLIKALQYVKSINGIIIQIPDDCSINAHGLMNEGIVSTRLGLPGKPSMAEEIMVARDIKLAAYSQSRIHFTGITTARSIELIREAKKQGVDVTCSVTPYHLFFSDEDMFTYDTNLKVNLPLRTKS
ncbi:MAG: dihydroorotase, partial [Chitinophagaceae bacterium]